MEKMKKKDLITLFAGLKVAETLSGKSEDIVKFLYGIDKNLNKIESEIKSLQKSSVALPDYVKYNQERIALAERHANKDKKEKPLKIMTSTGEEYDLRDENGEQKIEFTKAFEELKIKYKETLDKRTKQLEKYNESLEEEFEFEPHLISITLIPDDCAGKGIKKEKGGLLRILRPILKD